MRLTPETRARLQRTLFKKTSHAYDPTIVTVHSYFRAPLGGKIECQEVCAVCGLGPDSPRHDGVVTAEEHWRTYA